MFPPIVVMGVSGSGKTTVGAELAQRIRASFVDGDDLHPQSNVEKMARGVPLDDDDRAPWLDAIAARLIGHPDDPVVLACSALRRRYRDRLRSSAPGSFFLHLAGDEALLAARLGRREGHFMPAKLLCSQFSTLEPLAPDELGVTIDVSEQVDQIVGSALRALT